MTKTILEHSDFHVDDISSESERVYKFKTHAICINTPARVYRSKSRPNSHRVVDQEGWVHYVPSGWLSLKWKVKDGEKEVLF